MMYKNILKREVAEFNGIYRELNKHFPYMSVKEKQKHSFAVMLKNRGLGAGDFEKVTWNPLEDSVKFQNQVGSAVMYTELFKGGVPRYYVKDESLFDFFRNTEVRPKEVESILKSDLLNSDNNFFSCGGVLGKEQAYTIVVQGSRLGEKGQKEFHIVSVITEDMNYTFCIEQFDSKKCKDKAWVFNLAMNFLFYINAFPECVIDGVPNGVKKDSKAKVLSVSDKIISHKTVEHGFVRPHFRSGYFRHFNSDWYKNCKGQVRFIASTMVKGKAKTVVSK